MQGRIQRTAVLLSIMALVFCLGCSRETEEKQQKTTVEFEPSDTEKGPAPPKLPEKIAPGEITLTVLEDKRCTDRSCMTAPVIGKLQASLKGLKVVRCDWSTPECKQIFEREGLKYLPAYLFDASVKTHPAYSKIARFLHPTPKGAFIVDEYIPADQRCAVTGPYCAVVGVG